MTDDHDLGDSAVGVDPSPAHAPVYCPRCDREASPDAKACGACGETLRPRGYCPVCEAFLNKDVGEPCPKHDLPLEEAPVLPPSTAGGPATRWVTLETFSDEAQAEALRVRLEAEGIPTLLSGSRMGSRSMYLVATGGVKLQVPAALTADARVLLSQLWTPPLDADDLDDAWDELAPEPGAFRRRVMKRVILLIVFGPAVLALLGLLLRSVLWGD